MRSGDTIVALATAPVAAGLAVVRLSGPAALAIACTVTGRSPEALPHGQMRYGPLRDGVGGLIDRGYAVVFQAPRSFTGEDVAELHVHGSPAVVARLIEVACAAGARPAQAGEFTWRAFDNGKLDLLQAEALADLVSARSEAARRSALDHLDGQLTRHLAQLRDPMLQLVAELEAYLDFPDETGGAGPVPDELADRVEALCHEVARLRDTVRAGRVRLLGVRVVLYGAPNAGKSTLFNALVGADRAIVDARPGTTRDTLEAATAPGGLLVTWVDTAGVHDTADPVERQGTQRARAQAAVADIVLWVQDGGQPPAGSAPPLGRGGVCVAVRAKADRPRHPAWAAAAQGDPVIEVSAHTGMGIDGLRDAVLATARAIEAEAAPAGGVAIARTRHAEALQAASAALARAGAGMRAGLPLELAAADLRDATCALDEMTGSVATDDVLAAIFARFCIGK